MSNTPKLTPADWATVITAYQRGEKTVRDLATMFKVTPQAIHEGLRKRGITKGSRIADVQKETEDASAAAHKARVTAAHQTADRYSKYTDLLTQLTIKKITDAHAAGTIATAHAEVITLKNAMAIVMTGRKEQWTIQKIEEALQQDEELASLNVGEYTEEELDLIRQANEEAYNAANEEVDNLLDADGNLADDEDDDELVAI